MSTGTQHRRSFRLEITLLIGLLFLLILGLLSYGVYEIVYRAKLAEVDATLLAQADRVAPSLGPWLNRYQDDVRMITAEMFPLPTGESLYIWNREGEFISAQADETLTESVSEAVAGLSMKPDWRNYQLPVPRGIQGRPGPLPLEPGEMGRSGPRRLETNRTLGSISKHTHFMTIETVTGPVRMIAMQLNGMTIAIVDDMQNVKAQMAELRHALFIVLPITLLIAMGGGWIIASRAIRPVKLLADTASKVSKNALNQRLDDAHASREFAELIDVFNAMLERLERSFHQASRFSADAAHELRTPLTVLQGQVEQAMQEAAIGSTEQRFFNSLLEETQRLRNIVSKLLLLARSDAGHLHLAREVFDFSAMISDLWEDAHLLGDHLSYSQKIAPAILVNGDKELLAQVFTNLLGNAIHHNRDGGDVALSVSRVAGKATLRISNTGAAIPPEKAGLLFDRFYRVDESREAVSGSGLGLSLARELTRAHGGELMLEPSEDGRITFVLTLPTEV